MVWATAMSLVPHNQ